MLSAADRDALAAQWQQFRDEMGEIPTNALATLSWDRFIAWRTAVALELQAEALWEANGGEDDAEEPPPVWER